MPDNADNAHELWILDYMDAVQNFFSHDPDLSKPELRKTAETLEDYAISHGQASAFNEAKRMGLRDANADKELQ